MIDASVIAICHQWPFNPLLNQYDADVGRATGSGEIQEDFMSSLSRISQLTGTNFEPFKLYRSTRLILPTTGFSDPIYAEAYVKMHGFDILLGLSTFLCTRSVPDLSSTIQLSFIAYFYLDLFGPGTGDQMFCL